MSGTGGTLSLLAALTPIMRRLLIASSLLLAACQQGAEGNADLASGAPAAAQPSAPDTPVSSDDPPRPAPPEPTGPSSDCPVVRSSNWHAHVNAMPGPDARPKLIVTGRVTVPTGGYKVSLRMGQVAESFPVQITVYLDAIPPSGPATQALRTHAVRGSWPSEQQVGAVTIRCGNRSLARISPVETAV